MSVSLTLTYSDADAARIEAAFLNNWTKNGGETTKQYAERIINHELIKPVVKKYERAVSDTTFVNTFSFDVE